MGEAYFTKRGGANTSLAMSAYAMICARIPAGSTCVCAKGGERLTAENVPGIVSFPVPSSGAWTVTISDGARGRTGLVAISGHGEVRAIQISYPGAPSVNEGGVILSAQSGLKGGCTLGGNAIVSGNAIHENVKTALDSIGYEWFTDKQLEDNHEPAKFFIGPDVNNPDPNLGAVQIKEKILRYKQRINEVLGEDSTNVKLALNMNGGYDKEGNEVSWEKLNF